MEPEPERTLEYYREKAEEEAALRREVELELAVAQRRVACLEHRSLVAALTASFRLFDHDGDGFIVDAENMAVANTVQHYRPQFCDPAAEEIFARLQRSAIQADDGTEGGNDDGQISLEEFLSFGLRCFESVDEEAAVRTINGVNDALRSLLELDAEMKTLFELFDTDGSGGITVDENVEVAKLLSALAGETSARSGACRRTVVSSAFDEQACRDKFAATVSSHDANRDKQVSSTTHSATNKERKGTLGQGRMRWVAATQREIINNGCVLDLVRRVPQVLSPGHRAPVRLRRCRGGGADRRAPPHRPRLPSALAKVSTPASDSH
jgi:Ca2+-binding EF-hand superfamily protein